LAKTIQGVTHACRLEHPDTHTSTRTPCSVFENANAQIYSLTPPFVAGTYAEYVVAEADWLAKVPDNLPLEKAAGVPLVALTGWQALQQANPKAGQRVLVTAAAGGVGHITVQVGCASGGRAWLAWRGCDVCKSPQIG
jgi:NADPH:quinone reductase-like Zn-dependent oxidoreductase